MLQKVLIVMALLYTNIAHAALISAWELTNNAGNENFVSADSSAANVTGLNLTRGAGLKASSGADAFNAKGWNNFEPTDYFSFGFSVEAGYAVNLSNLQFGLRASNTGPSTLGLFYSADAFLSQLATFNLQDDSVHVQNIDLSFLQQLTETVEFRISSLSSNMASVNAGTVSAAGTLRLVEDADLSKLQFNGGVAAVPEPETYAMFLAGLGLIAFANRRRTFQACLAY